MKLYTARPTKKPSKAPAMTSISVWPIDSFNGSIPSATNFETSFASSEKPEDRISSSVCLILLPDLTNIRAFSCCGSKVVASRDKRDFSRPSTFGWELIKPSLSLECKELLTCIWSSSLFSVLAWIPTSLLTPCKSQKATHSHLSAKQVTLITKTTKFYKRKG